MKLNKVISSILLVSLFCFSLTIVSFAAEYKEAPELKQRVNDGELPPVKERLPENPKVVDNAYVDDIGEYGGTLRTLENHYPDTFGVITRVLGTGRVPAMWNHDVTKLKSNLAESFEMDTEGTELTINIRKGIKWSDGVELTADDYIFFWEDILCYSPDEGMPLTSILSDDYIVSGEPIDIEKVNKYTIKITTAGPAPALLNRLLADRGLALTPAPEHFLKQFHPKYNSAEGKDKNEQWDDFQSLAIINASGYSIFALENPDYPVLTPWKVCALDGEEPYQPGDRLVLSRNPYYWKVDKEGNQLPYINQIQSNYVADTELQLLKFQDGNVDFQIFPPEDPVLFQKQEEGNYHILKCLSFDLGPQYYENYNYSDYLQKEGASKEKIEVAKLLEEEPKFRKALMLGFSSQNLIDTFFLFRGKYYNRWLPPDREITHSSELSDVKSEIDSLAKKDLEKANQLLDELGLIKADDGWRYLEVDGEKYKVTVKGIVPTDPRTEPTAMYVSEKIRENLGVDFQVNAMDIGTYHTRSSSGNFQILMHDGLRKEYNFSPDNRRNLHYPLFNIWKNTDGEEGVKPDDQLYKKIVELDDKIKKTVDSEKRNGLIIERIKATLGNMREIFDPVRPSYMSTLVSNRIKNSPEELSVGNSTGWPHAYRVDQYYIEE